MPTESIPGFFWPAVNNTASIVALALGGAVFLFGLFAGARANKVRLIFAVLLATAIGWFAMPLVIKGAQSLKLLETKTGGVVVISVMMGFVAALATSIYEIVTVTLADIGHGTRR
jgi:hypothetical protein